MLNCKKLVFAAATAGPLLVGLAPAATAAPTSAPVVSATQVAKPAPKAAVTYKQYYNVVRKSCMDSKKGVRIAKCVGKKHPGLKYQLWALHRDGTFRARVNGKCLTVRGSAGSAFVGKCEGNNSKWTWMSGRALKHKATKKCLTTSPPSQGVLLTLRKCGSTMGQKWRKQ
ncbi:RICIN domain-containing protein [Actinomadura sp. 6N118]|uniref:RICIN domain-containing protein n=1 Tax=Actinomadura sp. 6N118 TaxID=3375151 RepID=UPI00379DBAB8